MEPEENNMASDLGERVGNFFKVMYRGSRKMEEGKDYTTLAYSDWADMFIPTVIKWKNGKVDDFRDLDESLHNRESVKKLKKVI
jgi:hypothetical protein